MAVLSKIPQARRSFNVHVASGENATVGKMPHVAHFGEEGKNLVSVEIRNASVREEPSSSRGDEKSETGRPGTIAIAAWLVLVLNSVHGFRARDIAERGELLLWLLRGGWHRIPIDLSGVASGDVVCHPHRILQAGDFGSQLCVLQSHTVELAADEVEIGLLALKAGFQSLVLVLLFLDVHDLTFMLRNRCLTLASKPTRRISRTVPLVRISHFEALAPRSTDWRLRSVSNRSFISILRFLSASL